jgi:hypothetical protein
MISGQVHATGSNQIGMHISVNGVLHFVYGAESCASQEVTCGPGQSVFPYLTLGNGVNYVLVGGKVDAWPDGTRMLVTGWVTPSTASAPYLSFAGDIIITSIHAHCHMHQ